MKIQIIAFLLFLASCDGQSKKVSSESIKPVTEEMGEKPLDLELLRSIIDKQKNVETEENEPEQP